jgi:hypothetical protein
MTPSGDFIHQLSQRAFFEPSSYAKVLSKLYYEEVPDCMVLIFPSYNRHLQNQGKTSRHRMHTKKLSQGTMNESCRMILNQQILLLLALPNKKLSEYLSGFSSRSTHVSPDAIWH